MSQVELLTRAINVCVEAQTVDSDIQLDPSAMILWLSDQRDRMLVEENRAGIPHFYRHVIRIAHAVLGDDI